MRKFLLIITILCIFSPAIVAQQFPRNCKPINFKFERQNLILNTTKKSDISVFLFHNISTKSFWLDHAVMHPAASAGWGSKLDQGNWSAILLNQSHFTMTCSQIQPDSVNYLSCRKVLRVCELQNVSFNKTNGSYWLAENQPFPLLIKTLRQRVISWYLS